MKKRLGLLALAAVLSSSIYAASIDHIQTYAPEYLGNSAQNGMINNVSAYYNPAGIVHLEKGTYVQVGAQLAVGHEKMEYNGKDYKADLLQPIPNFAMYKVEDDSALYWTFGALGGGGDLKYDDGVAGTAVVGDILEGIGKPGFNTNGSKAEGSNLYVQSTLGKVWKVNDKLSLSAAGRVIYGSRTLKGDIYLNHPLIPKSEEAHIDSERTAWGFGGQFGLNYRINDRLNFGLRYDTRVNLNFEADAKGEVKIEEIGGRPIGSGLGFSDFYPEYADGIKQRRDLPAILAAGMSYKVTDNWTIGLSGNYYFNKDAKMDRTKKSNHPLLAATNHIEAEYDNGYEIAVGTEYRFSPKWAILGGVNYANTGAKVTSYDDVEFALDSIMVGTGLKYNPDETSEWVFTVAHYFYDSESGHYDQKYPNPPFANVKNPEYSKSITAFGVAYTKRF
ncbi:outer membrane protein transport protein [uncultured Fusobacterium sp.]|uniref:OmpP1/FadL family transporter n=1 Tax=uncultured Fusobacterium sp. TaxID=159267 RepID=UPI0025E44911|nr:outer membrane protein transport protein [uncultured Fusobacterium sp.]